MDSANYEEIINTSSVMLKMKVEEAVRYACDKIIESAKRKESCLKQQMEEMKNDLELISSKERHLSEDHKNLKEKCNDLDEHNAELMVEIKILKCKIQQRDDTILAYKNINEQRNKNKLELTQSPKSSKNKLIRYISKRASLPGRIKKPDQSTFEPTQIGFVESTETNEEIMFENFKKVLCSNDSNLQCSICKELFVFSTVTNCGHIFCEGCIETWTGISNTCPICRKYINQQIPINDLDNHIEKCVEHFMEDNTREERFRLIKERNVEKDKRVQMKQRKRDAPRKFSLGSIGNTQILVNMDNLSTSSSSEDDFVLATNSRYHRLSNA